MHNLLTTCSEGGQKDGLMHLRALPKVKFGVCFLKNIFIHCKLSQKQGESEEPEQASVQLNKFHLCVCSRSSRPSLLNNDIIGFLRNRSDVEFVRKHVWTCTLLKNAA